MASETSIQMPASLSNETDLRRVLLQIVDKLDTLSGLKGDTVETAATVKSELTETIESVQSDVTANTSDISELQSQAEDFENRIAKLESV